MRSGLLILGLLVMAGSASAADRPCKADAAKLCAGIPRGGGRIVQCLKDHQAELSDACRAKLGAAKQKAQDVRAACADDRQKYCGAVRPGRGRVLVCLHDHQQDLSPACQQALAEKR